MKYTVSGGVAEFGTDVILQLTEEQAAPRAHALEEMKDGRYRPTSVVQFKAGETVDVDLVPTQLTGTLGAVLVPSGAAETGARPGEDAGERPAKRKARRPADPTR